MTTRLFACLFYTSLLGWTQMSFAQTGIQAGLWETQIVHQTMDGRDMTAQMMGAQARMQAAMAHLTPAQRERMPSAMLGAAAPGAGAGMRLCISKEMADRNQPMIDREGHCAPTQVSRHGDSTTFTFDCTREGRHTVGQGKSTFSANTVLNDLDMTVSDAHGTHRMQTESRMTYLGADCHGLPPAGSASNELKH